MAVTNNATLIEDHETAPAYTSIGGGQGAGTETNFYFRGVTSSSRKMNAVTKNGFWFNPGTTFDLSGTGEHVKVFINAITQAGFTDFWMRLGDSTTTYEEHAVTTAFYDNDAGGWIPVWIEVDAGTDTGTPDFTAIDEIAVICTMGAISGNVKNWVTDQAHHATRPVLQWDSTGGDLDDFITTELTAGVGCLKLLNGLYTCFASLQLGSATSTTFDMDGKTIAFPDATWLPAASTWMGLDIDLQHASTDITAIGGSIISGNPAGASARKPDIIVTGTSGVVDFTGRLFDGMRVMELTSGVTLDAAVIANSGLVTAAGASLINASILTSAVAADEGAMFDDRTIGTTTTLNEYEGMTFSKGPNSHHAIRFGANVTGDLTLNNIEFADFVEVEDDNGCALRFDATSGSMTVNLVGCTVGGVPATALNLFKDDAAGVAVTLAFDTITLEVTVLDATDDTPLTTAHVQLLKDSDKSVLLSGAVNGSGVISTSIAYDADTDVIGWAREHNISGVDYTQQDFSGEYTINGFFITIRLVPVE